ncbi:MAG TPA: tetratricopeptide repeat protein [Blastocatellia bacterium]|nr:tetratricopeptide repeat protein [Blastocatellia bacterium]
MTSQPDFLYRPFTQAVFLFTILSVCAAQSLAQSGGGASNNPTGPGRGVSHTIRGKIFMPAGNLPDQRLRVVLELSTGGIVSEVFSDSVGNFEFRSLTNGTYKIVVPSDGHAYETSQEVVEIYGNFTRTFTSQIYLKDKGEGVNVKTKEKIVSVAELQQIPKDAKKSFDNGVKRARENKPEAAVTLFQDAIRIFPEYLAALNKLGEQLRALNKMTEARAAFEKAIDINEKYALPHINLGLLLVDQKRYDEAITALENGIKLDDTFPMAHLKLGEALMSKQPPDYDRAEKEMTRAMELGKRDFVQVRQHLFNLNLRRQRLDKAAEQLEAYLKEAPDAPDAEQVRQTLGRVKKAIDQQKAATKN